MDNPPEYVAARAVLLDALQALNAHLPAIIVVGAQAVYLRTGFGDFAEPPMTTDGDLALDVTLLGAEPEITEALGAAEFELGRNPGSWIGKGGVAVDIMVVPSQSGRTKRNARGARLPGHANTAARITPGFGASAGRSRAPHTYRAGSQRPTPGRGERRRACGLTDRQGDQDCGQASGCSDKSGRAGQREGRAGHPASAAGGGYRQSGCRAASSPRSRRCEGRYYPRF